MSRKTTPSRLAVPTLVPFLIAFFLAQTAQAQTFAIIVNIGPPEAQMDGAAWTPYFNGIPVGGTVQWHRSGEAVNVRAPGNYVIMFKDIPGWRTPADQTISLLPNMPIVTANGAYEAIVHDLRVTLTPVAVVDAGAQWQLIDDEGRHTGWIDSEEVRNDLRYGTYTIQLKTVSGWTAPDPFTLQVRDEDPSIIEQTFTYGENGSVTISINPPEAVQAGAQWRVKDSLNVAISEWLNPGETIQNLPFGNYQVEFRPVPGWAEPQPLPFIVSSVQYAYERNVTYLDFGSICTPSGEVKVTILPNEAAADGARWFWESSPQKSSGEILSNIPEGWQKIQFTDLWGWHEPRQLTLRICPGLLTQATATFSPLTVYPFSQIPNQMRNNESRLEFMIDLSEISDSPTLTCTADPQPLGSLSLDVRGTLAQFRYSPHDLDRHPFEVTFTAESGGTQVKSRPIRISPFNLLPTEQATLGITPDPDKAPDPESRDYLRIVTTPLDAAIDMNYAAFRGAPTQPFKLEIVGKSIVFESGHPNNLYDLYNNIENLYEMVLYADVVIIRSPLHLPQTNLTVYAKALVFDDTGRVPGNAFISTTPVELEITPEPFQNGVDGLRAGDVTLYVGAIRESHPGHARFILAGGKGQAAGHGENGIDGASIGTVDPNWKPGIGDLADNAILAMDTSTQISGGLPNFLGVSPTQFILTYIAPFVQGQEIPSVDSLRAAFAALDLSAMNGTAAKPAGRPGNGGDSGHFRSLVQVPDNLLNLSGGAPGTPSDAIGGKKGTPYPATVITNINFTGQQDGLWYVLYTHDGHKDGRSYPAHVGKTGLTSMPMGIANTQPFSWLHPCALETFVSFVSDCYRQEYYPVCYFLLSEYDAVLHAYKQSPAWNALPAPDRITFQAAHEEISLLLYRIVNQMDYFGNPFGWVPMLSFEVNKTAFENEIDTALRTLYLVHWMKSALPVQTEKVNALLLARDQLMAANQTIVDEFEAAKQLIPELEAEETHIQQKIANIRPQLALLESDIIDQAFAAFSPEYAEMMSLVGSFQDALSSSGMGSVLSMLAESLENLQVVDSPDTVNYGFFDDFQSYMEFLNTDNIDLIVDQIRNAIPSDGNMTQEDVIEYISEQVLENPLAILLDPSQLVSCYIPLLQYSVIIATTKEELLAKIKEIRASTPEYQELFDDYLQLLEEQDDHCSRLRLLYRRVATAMVELRQNLLAIAEFNQETQVLNDRIDLKTEMFLDRIERRAKERLQKYHYYMVKAYEYRMLKPYPGELDLDVLFAKFLELAAKDNADGTLSQEDFHALKALYEEQVATVAAVIYDQYNSNRPELSAPIRPELTPEELQRINAGETVAVNLFERGIFSPSEENIRIVNIQVKEFTAHSSGGGYASSDYLDLIVQHEGLSLLAQNGAVYRFLHYNKNTQNPILWGARYHAFDGDITPVGPSAASESLIKSLLQSSGRPADDIMFFSRPGAWANLFIKKEVNTLGGTDIVIDQLRLEVQYDFTRRSDDMKTLAIRIANDEFTPYTLVGTPDLNARTDVLGSSYRTYHSGSGVTLTAQNNYGTWVFAGWTDKSGNLVGSNTTIHLTLNSHTTLTALYKLSGELPAVMNWIRF